MQFIAIGFDALYRRGYYLVVFGAPSVKPDLIHFAVVVLSNNVADPPVALVILGVDEVALVIGGPDSVVILGKR